MVQEDGTTQSRQWMASQGRDGSIWRFDIGGGTPRIDWRQRYRVAELDPPGQYDPTPIGPGVWETSGIIDAVDVLVRCDDDDDDAATSGSSTSRRTSATRRTEQQQFEDGQLLLLWGVDDDDDDEDDDD